MFGPVVSSASTTAIPAAGSPRLGEHVHVQHLGSVDEVVGDQSGSVVSRRLHNGTTVGLTLDCRG